MPFTIVRQDITKMKVDAIVNAANTELRMGGGVCGAIFWAAGAEKMQEACDQKAPIQTGGAAITPGFALPAKYVIHAAGPVYTQWNQEQARGLLRSAYLESLKLAALHGCRSIAFPLISSGIYGYPKKEALQVASAAIQEFLAVYEMNVYLAVFDKSSLSVSEELMGDVESYIDEHYVDAHHARRRELLDVEKNALRESSFAPAEGAASIPLAAARPESAPPIPPAAAAPGKRQAPILPAAAAPEKCRASIPSAAAAPAQPGASLEELVGHLDEPFSDTLLKLIDAKGKTDVEVYKKANIDRKLFSKIRSVKGYTPKKPTILALAVSLELSLPETDDLLERAGYALSHASKFDVIVEYFIIHHKYNIFDINEVLFQYDQPLLGA